MVSPFPPPQLERNRIEIWVSFFRLRACILDLEFLLWPILQTQIPRIIIMKRPNFFFLFAVVMSLLFPSFSQAVPANPEDTEITQPDGSVFKARILGDEWSNRVETQSGFTIGRDQDGTWRHVLKFEGKTAILGITPADQPPSPDLIQGVRPDSPRVPSDVQGLLRTTGLAQSQGEGPNAAPIGNFNGPILFILAEFSNRAGTYGESTWGNFVSNNIADYFNKASYGKVNLTPANETSGVGNNGVIGWVNLGYPHPNTASSTSTVNQQITKDAIIAANPFIDYSSYDTNGDNIVDSDELAVVIVVAGFERAFSSSFTPSVWGHKWSVGFLVGGAPNVDGVVVGSFNGGNGGYAQFGEIHQSNSSNQHQATMGIMVHELGHLIFGLPDLYDTDNSSSGIGAFGVMGGGSWGRANGQAHSGESPVLPSAWTKLKLGWVDETEGVSVESFTAAGNPGANSTNTVRKSSTSTPTQYFLTENRQPEGYDLGLQRWLGTNFGGIAIWHIDDSQSTNRNDANRLVDLEEGDGTQMGTSRGSATDLWYQGNGTTFNDTSTPNSKLNNGTASNVAITNISASATVMTADFGGVAPGELAVSTTDDFFSTGEVGGPFNPASMVYGISNSGGVSIDYTVTKTQPWIDVTNASGTLAPGNSVNVTVSINGTANSLVDGVFNDTLTITNTTNGNGDTTRDVTLTVLPANNVQALNDFDNDQDSDLLMVHDSGVLVASLLQNSVPQTFEFLLQADPNQGWSVHATADFNGDNNSDLLLANTTTGDYRVVTMNGSSVIADTFVLFMDPVHGLEPRGVGDFNGDGLAEIIFYHPVSGFTALAYLNGGVFSSFETVTVVDEANNWTLKDAVDFTGDGKTDLLITNTVTGDASVIEMNGSIPVSTTPVLTLDPATGWTYEDTGDFTGDGDTDVLILHTSGALGVLVMDGLVFQSLYVPGGLQAGWELVNSGHYNNDSNADFLFHVPATGELIVGLQDGATITAYNVAVNLGPASGWNFHGGKP